MILLQFGSRGEAVKQVQRALHLVDDGIFGTLTREAVITFQREKGLTPDGIVGPATLAKLIPQRLKKSKRTIREIIVHCTDTPEGRNHTVEDITKWHKDRGWATIGYHFVVDIEGNILEGRDVDLIGAHCSRHNSHSIGVVYVGGRGRNWEYKDTRNDLQKNSLLSLLIDLKKLYPDATIYGHNYFDKGKPCPCFDAYREYKNL